MLVWPASFGFNEETAVNNAFQDVNAFQQDTLTKARTEFDQFNTILTEHGVNTIVIKDLREPIKPDAIFPNNWISFHPDRRVILYPMYAKNRRLERRPEILDQVRTSFEIKEVIDLSHHEAQGKFLEGTGSMIFDHLNRKAYACLSPRTDLSLFQEVCGLLDYEPIPFHSVGDTGHDVYHTNVMMALGTGYVVICMESIPKKTDREFLLTHFQQSNLEVIELSLQQMNGFAGNMLEVLGTNNKRLIICSQRAFDSLTEQQRQQFNQYGQLVSAAVPTIESVGGGSVRCMMAEIFLPDKG